MRVSDSMVSELSQRGLSASRARALAAQEAASSGKRVRGPSDDPTAAAIARRRLAETERVRAMLKTADDGLSRLDAVDEALAHMGELTEIARAIAVQGANGTLGSQERAELATQIGEMRASLLAATATRRDGRYLLNGLREDAAPYDATGTFVGDRNVRQVEVAPGHFVSQTLAVGEVLAPAGGTDVLAAFSALETALRTGDVPGIRAGIDAMRAGTDQVADARAQVGTSMAAMDQAKAFGERTELRLVGEVSELTDVDAFDALSELQASQQALEQAVAIAARLPLPGLAQAMR